ncbi:MAG: hypothetical protein PUH21_01155 [Prevotellaceae bacterium]|nr:hypothetical protein [Prevotellaceae bacterium]MDY3857040.1 hypothetical protein [Bacteroidaceae bacterium]
MINTTAKLAIIARPVRLGRNKSPMSAEKNIRVPPAVEQEEGLFLPFPQPTEECGSPLILRQEHKK